LAEPVNDLFNLNCLGQIVGCKFHAEE
jgi:hypothetical protein